jgi:leucyl aminopeptidase
MMSLLENWTAEATPIDFVDEKTWPHVVEGLAPNAAAYAKATGFSGKAGAVLLAPGADGKIERVLFGVEAFSKRRSDAFAAGRLATALPPGLYRLRDAVEDPDAAALAFLLSGYSFSRYRKPRTNVPKLCAPQGGDRARVERIASAVAYGRDIVNTPANDMGPEALGQTVVDLAKRYGAQPREVIGDKLLEEKFPLIHAVGRGAAQAPRLVEFSYGPPGALKVTLVGKGVCFDTGGLDIKPSSAMLLMKKDKGGAATALSLASLLMDANVPVRLRVIIPIVENSVSATSFRASDVYPSRKGLSVEIGNTDAEGRLILADALTLASEDAPDLLFDFATLTGAARVALGPDLPPYYTGDDALAAEIDSFARSANDPVWRLPLWDPYDSGLDGKISDVVNVTSGGFAGSITAGLFLRRFVADPEKWAHFDVYCWNGSTKPGRPEGGEIQVARLLYDLIESRAARGSGTK